MSTFDPQAYGPAFAPLLAIDRGRALGPGAPDRGARAALEGLSAESAFEGAKIADGDMAACCVSGLWLLHDYLDESHTISQGIDTPTGSFWHAIMHRREGDFSNSKYWFRRVGRHEAFGALVQRAAELSAARGAERAAKKLFSGHAWDPFAFVDMCQASAGDQNDASQLCRDIQQAEWELLFDHCYRSATNTK